MKDNKKENNCGLFTTARPDLGSLSKCDIAELREEADESSLDQSCDEANYVTIETLK